MNKNAESRKQTYSSKAVLSELERKNAEFIKMKREKELKGAPTQSKGNKFGHLKKKEDLER